MNYILTFNKTIYAIKAEQLLLSKGLIIKVMPIPTSLKAGCGIALRINKDDIEIIDLILKDNNINYDAYLKNKNNYERVI